MRFDLERLRMEAAWLQAQIKPHFMINTFNAIVALSRLDLDRMDDLIQELSNYIRLSIDFQNTDGVAPLECELQLVRSYLFIMKQRFGDRLNVVWEVDEHIPLDIPPLTIQPLVENAISHGILKRPEGGDIHICIKDQGRFAKISIIDNGVGMDEETLKQLLNRKSEKRVGIGLLNIERRLKQLFGNGLKIESELAEGTIISFTVPKTENRQNN
ncbi:MAG TPA: sensor histidine kinase [Bacilli bacterium]|nr:sensor histidine kinase [Bacilli bacterium]